MPSLDAKLGFIKKIHASNRASSENVVVFVNRYNFSRMTGCMDNRWQWWQICSHWVWFWRKLIKNEACLSTIMRIDSFYSFTSFWKSIKTSFIFFLIYRMTLQCRWGTTADFATILFYHVLFSAVLVELTLSIPVHSLTLSSSLFFYLTHLLFSLLCAAESSLLKDMTLRRDQTI